MTDVAQRNRYSTIAILLHWATFALLFLVIKIGWSLEELKDAQKLAAMQLHKSLGMTILLLTILRIVWRRMNPPPPLPATMSARDIKLSKAIHHSFYFLLIFIPFLGAVIIGTSSYRFPTHFWGLFEVPTLPLGGYSFSKPLHKAAEFAHSKLAWVGILLMLLHAAAALKHQFVDKDGVLGRMLPFLKH